LKNDYIKNQIVIREKIACFDLVEPRKKKEKITINFSKIKNRKIWDW